MEQSFKIMTLNIHNFCNSEMDDPSPEISKVIEGYDIVALQEVYNMKKIKELVKDYNYYYNRGTLLMTKHPIKEVIKSRFRDEFSYSSFSEGEKAKIDLALLFTWREVARMKNSVATNLLILDEVFDSSLDAEGTNELLKILHALGISSNIFVI